MKSQVTFQKNYPSINLYDQSGTDVLPMNDGGYLICGTTTNEILNDMDIYVVKTDNMGVPIWTKSYGGNKVEYANSMLETSDGNYFIVGYSQSYGGGDYDIYLIKIKPNGDTLWTKTYGDWGNDQGNEIIPTADGNYIIIGTSNGLATSNYDALMLKIDIDGNEKWKKNYGGNAYESGQS
ncbi:MAG: hypothetical protein H0W84_09595, partial [Bacteroidetes bacterium]|nr:hypothetical protein [Bacteroidota bacterium]